MAQTVSMAPQNSDAVANGATVLRTMCARKIQAPFGRTAVALRTEARCRSFMLVHASRAMHLQIGLVLQSSASPLPIEQHQQTGEQQQLVSAVACYSHQLCGRSTPLTEHFNCCSKTYIIFVNPSRRATPDWLVL